MYQARFVAAAQPGRVLPAASGRAPRACLGRLRIHRPQARHRRIHRDQGRPRRKPLDTAYPRQRLSRARNPSRTAIPA